MQLWCWFPGNLTRDFPAAHFDLLGLMFVSDWVSLLGRQQHSSEKKNHTQTNKCTAEGPAELS